MIFVWAGSRVFITVSNGLPLRLRQLSAQIKQLGPSCVEMLAASAANILGLLHHSDYGTEANVVPIVHSLLQDKLDHPGLLLLSVVTAFRTFNVSSSWKAVGRSMDGASNNQPGIVQRNSAVCNLGSFFGLIATSLQRILLLMLRTENLKGAQYHTIQSSFLSNSKKLLKGKFSNLGKVYVWGLEFRIYGLKGWV